MAKNKLIEVIDLKTYFYTEAGTAKAVDGISFDISWIFNFAIFNSI